MNRWIVAGLVFQGLTAFLHFSVKEALGEYDGGVVGRWETLRDE